MNSVVVVAVVVVVVSVDSAADDVDDYDDPAVAVFFVDVFVSFLRLAIFSPFKVRRHVFECVNHNRVVRLYSELGTCVVILLHPSSKWWQQRFLTICGSRTWYSTVSVSAVTAWPGSCSLCG